MLLISYYSLFTFFLMFKEPLACEHHRAITGAHVAPSTSKSSRSLPLSPAVRAEGVCVLLMFKKSLSCKDHRYIRLITRRYDLKVPLLSAGLDHACYTFLYCRVNTVSEGEKSVGDNDGTLETAFLLFCICFDFCQVFYFS